jgi:antitoxin PrlF
MKRTDSGIAWTRKLSGVRFDPFREGRRGELVLGGVMESLITSNPAIMMDPSRAVRIFLTFSRYHEGYEARWTQRPENRMIKSKLTAKAQTTIPRPVREALRLEVGDEIAYQIQGKRVIVTKAQSASADDPFVTFSEWDSDADREGYGNL